MCTHPDVDVVLVLTSMTEHGRLARAALEAGKHVLVEKPVATTLAEAEQVLAAADAAPGVLVCAPHILLSPTYRAMHARVRAGEIGGLLTARGRYGWAGPDWNRWYYEPGGGALFDLGVYNVTSLCGFLGPARRVTAMTGVAIPERVINGEPMRVQAEDNAHVLIDFGDARFAVVTTGFTMQRYRSPCLELYGTHGVLQMLGDDWAPEGYELWRNDRATWELHPESDPTWSWTEGLRHLVECLETGSEPVTRPEHAYHALEIMLAAQAAGRDGRAREIASDFPEPDLARLGATSCPCARARPAERDVSLVERRAPPPSSPRPTFDGPALIRRSDVTRHVWGDPEAGEVYDWIYASTERVHMLVFGLSPGGAFRHSEDFRTIFAADEVLHVLQGVLVIADPETGEVQRAGTGESVFFRRDTWHHAFALGPEPLRVLELFAPPPAAGASSAYARAQPYLEQSRYADDALLGRLAARLAAAGAPARAAPGGRAVAARPRRALRCARLDRAPDRRDVRDRTGRDRRAA